MGPSSGITNWLLQGDAAIRWQTKRDLLKVPFNSERKRVAKSGWGERLLRLQCEDGRWTKERGPNGYRGLYTPKWTSTTYTLLLLCQMGIPPANQVCQRGCMALADGSQWFDNGSVAPWNSKKTDMCVCGMFLLLFTYFEHQSIELRNGLIEFLLANQKNDGGWNCLPSSVSSVHSTLTILESLHAANLRLRSEAIEESLAKGQEYLLDRQLMYSRRTGKIIDARFTRFSFPTRWKYDVLRALEYFREANVPDKRLEEAIALVMRKQRSDGKWLLQNRHSGETHFEMERIGEPSRWNTMRAFRVLNWWRESQSS